MRLTLDHLAATTLAAAASGFTALASSALALRTVAERNAVPAARVLRVAWERPCGNWPADLQIAASLIVCITLIIGFLSLWLAWGHQFIERSRDLSSVRAAKELLSRSSKDEPKIFAGMYESQRFFASVEDRGLVVGPPGTGKTAFLCNQVLSLATQKTSFVAIDIKPELHKLLSVSLEKSAYRIVRLNPAIEDSNADHWNPLEEISDETALFELCAALLPVRDPREAPYIESQRDWLKAAVLHISKQPGGSLPMAYDFLSSGDPQETLKILLSSQNANAQRIARRLQAGLSGPKPDPLIAAGLSGALRGLDFLGLPGVRSALGHSDFSMRESLSSSTPTAIFLQFDESKLQALAPVLSFISASVIGLLIETATERPPVAVFLDELGNMPPLPGLGEKLNTIRSRNMPTWMYFQTLEQIDRRYGNGSSSVFMAATDIQMFFRLNDQPSRELVSKLVGTTWRKKYSRTESADRGSVSFTRETVNVIEPHALGKLTPGEVVTLYRGAAARGQARPYFIDYPEFKRRKA